MTTDECIGQIIAVLKSESKPVNPAVITQKLEWNKDRIEEICGLFGAKSFTEVLRTIDGVEISKDENKTAYVQFISKDNSANESSLRPRLYKLLSLLKSGLYEKDEAVRLALLSAVAGESIFFLGPPGTAKSMISSRIHKAFTDDTKYFEYLMNEFSTPDEIFGSIKLKGLDEGIYEKNTTGYLPEAHVAFLDEIWKSGPAILNTLLTIINEKKFHNGNTIEEVPLQILLAASNELPKEKAGLEALYDRFIVRTLVNPVSIENEESFFDLCEKSGRELVITENMRKQLLSIEEIRSWQDKISKVRLEEKIREVIMEIRRELVRRNAEKDREEKDKFYVSDRRWKKIIHLLKTSAFLCDRPAVDLMDCQLVSYCIWNTPKQRDEACDIVKEIVREHGLECTTAIEDIEDQIGQFEKDVDATWYKMIERRTHEEPVMRRDSSNYIYYKVSKNSRGIGYISKNYPEDYYLRNYGRHYWMDENFDDQRTIDYIKIDEKAQTITINQTDILKMETETKIDDEGGLVKDTVIFNNTLAYASTKKSFDAEHYSPIVDSIAKELKALEDFRARMEKPYSENLFADQSFKVVITSKIAEEKQKLEDAQVELDKQRSRYGI